VNQSQPSINMGRKLVLQFGTADGTLGAAAALLDPIRERQDSKPDKISALSLFSTGVNWLKLCELYLGGVKF
jgi:hypothetical protein